MKKLRWRLVKIVFFSVVVVFAIMNLILTVSLRTYNNSQADQMTRIISDNNGTVPKMKDYDENSSTDDKACVVFTEGSREYWKLPVPQGIY